jgi:hypothetical protein
MYILSGNGKTFFDASTYGCGETVGEGRIQLRHLLQTRIFYLAFSDIFTPVEIKSYTLRIYEEGN